MFKCFYANSTRKCIDILDELVEEYNNTKHSSIGMIPKEASQTINEAEVWRNLGNYSPPNQPKRKAPKFSLGDKIRSQGKRSLRERIYTTMD